MEIGYVRMTKAQEEELQGSNKVSNITMHKSLFNVFDYKEFENLEMFLTKHSVYECIDYGTLEQHNNQETYKCDTIYLVKKLTSDNIYDSLNFDEECSGIGNFNFCNRGNGNSGNGNIGNFNSGNDNKGNNNIGDNNIGDNNIGWFNITNNCIGDFNTVEPTITLFNKPTNMTRAEWENTDGFKILQSLCIDYAQEWWDGLTEEEHNIVYNIPNFNAQIFTEITKITL